jgi:hypothetical protein
MSQVEFKTAESKVSSYIKNENQRVLPESQISMWNNDPEQASQLPELGVSIRRIGDVKLYPFTDFFKGFEKVEAVRSTFGQETDDILKNLKVEFFSFKYGYMAVSDIDGHLLISTHHLKTGEFRVLYLDVAHELVHVKQFMEGRKLFNHDFEYVDNPTEIEAYRHAVKEARRIGMSDSEIIEYLKVEWIDEDSLHRLVESVGLGAPSAQ